MGIAVFALIAAYFTVVSEFRLKIGLFVVSAPFGPPLQGLKFFLCVKEALTSCCPVAAREKKIVSEPSN